MPSIRLTIAYNKNEGLLISPSELRENYLFGIPVCTSDGRKLSAQTIKQHISAAQKRIETLFSIKLNRQVICESKDFNRQEWLVWNFVKSTYPVARPINLFGFINAVRQVTYPAEWISIKHSEAVAAWRNVYIIPNTDSEHGVNINNQGLIFNGVLPFTLYQGKEYIPNYWHLKYITGWRAGEVPDDLADLVSKWAAINVLAIIGSYLYGVQLASYSVSLDGVSQSFPLRSGKYGTFSDRIELYKDDINQVIESMKYIYKGLTWTVV